MNTPDNEELIAIIHKRYYINKDRDKVLIKSNDKELKGAILIKGVRLGLNKVAMCLTHNTLISNVYFLNGNNKDYSPNNMMDRNTLTIEMYINSTFYYDNRYHVLRVKRDLNKYKKGDIYKGRPQTIVRSDDSKYIRYTTKLMDNHILIHRLIWFIVYGEWPKQQIDHIDGNPSNNSILNLRDVSHTDNMNNRIDNNEHRYIMKRKGRIKCYYVRHKDIKAASFYTLEEAIVYRDSQFKLLE